MFILSCLSFQVNVISVVYCNNIFNNNLKIPFSWNDYCTTVDGIACIASGGYIATVESSLKRPSLAAEDS